ncbi:MAG: hypothetical protein IPL29_08545 [Propionivibrio sp.]|nr:hypothetical protein [Propionivibrio sp.]
MESAGVALKKAGKDGLGRCLFHEDREASLVVTPAKNLCQRMPPAKFAALHRQHAADVRRPTTEGIN